MSEFGVDHHHSFKSILDSHTCNGPCWRVSYTAIQDESGESLPDSIKAALALGKVHAQSVLQQD